MRARAVGGGVPRLRPQRLTSPRLDREARRWAGCACAVGVLVRAGRCSACREPAGPPSAARSCSGDSPPRPRRPPRERRPPPGAGGATWRPLRAFLPQPCPAPHLRPRRATPAPPLLGALRCRAGPGRGRCRRAAQAGGRAASGGGLTAPRAEGRRPPGPLETAQDSRGLAPNLRRAPQGVPQSLRTCALSSLLCSCVSSPLPSAANPLVS